MKIKLRNNLYMIVVILALVGLFVFAMIEGGFVSWFLFYSFLIISFYIVSAYLYPIDKWKVTRTISKPSYEAGDTVGIEVHLERKFPFPLFYAFCEEELESSIQRKDASNEKFKDLDSDQTIKKSTSFIALLPILFKRRIILEYSIPSIPRGAHELRRINLKVSDLFGCIKKEATYLCQDDVHVYPRVRSVVYLNDGQSMQQDSGSVSSMIKGIQSTLPGGVREYTSGDRLAWIDWKQTAKMNEMMTKQFEREQDTNVLMIFDHLFYEEMNMLAFEGVVETTVAMLHDMVRQATHTTLLSVGAGVTYMDLEPSAVESGQLAQYFMRVTPERGQTFGEQLEEYSSSLSGKAQTWIISSQVTDDIVEALGHIHMRSGATIFVCIISENEQTNEVHQRFEKLKSQGIQVIVLSEEALVKDPIEVITYGAN